MVLLASAFAPASIFLFVSFSLAIRSANRASLPRAESLGIVPFGDAVLKLSINQLASRLLSCFQAVGTETQLFVAAAKSLGVVRLVCPGKSA